MYTIKRAAELTGISVATLRAWERRYGVVSPQRSDGGYRLYGPEDVRALAIMNSLVNEGWSAREAAAETTRRLSSRDPAGRETPFGRGDRESRASRVAPLRPGGRYQSEDAEAFIRAAERLDSASATAVLDARFALGTFEHVVDDWLMPTLQLVGEASDFVPQRLVRAAEPVGSFVPRGQNGLHVDVGKSGFCSGHVTLPCSDRVPWRQPRRHRRGGPRSPRAFRPVGWTQHRGGELFVLHFHQRQEAGDVAGDQRAGFLDIPTAAANPSAEFAHIGNREFAIGACLECREGRNGGCDAGGDGLRNPGQRNRRSMSDPGASSWRP